MGEKLDARSALELIADFIEARTNNFEYDEETQESILDDITARFESAITGK